MSVDQESLTFRKFALFVTGVGESRFLHLLFQPLMKSGLCSFQVVHKLEQRSPITSPGRKLQMVGKGKTIPDRDEEEIGLPARKHLLAEGYDFILLVDDLEHDREPHAQAVYDRYRQAFDVMLEPSGQKARASVHFLANMLEAYYFADAQAVNSVLGTSLVDHAGDVEAIPHPKNELKRLVRELGTEQRFHEVDDGQGILNRLDVEKVLSRPDTCRYLRTAFAWCWRALGCRPTARFCLADGELAPVTAAQLELLPAVST